MKIAVISEISTADRNGDIMEALKGFDHEVLNVGMKCAGEPQLSAVHAGFLAALFLNAKKADLVVGGCGTGQAFIMTAMQFPGVFCGLITSPLDAWLFRQINGGNCLSLPLNKGYGWGSDANLKFIFEKFFSVKSGAGYPAHREIPQLKARELLADLSTKFHRTMSEIIMEANDDLINPSLKYPGVLDLLEVDTIEDEELKEALKKRIETI